MAEQVNGLVYVICSKERDSLAVYNLNTKARLEIVIPFSFEYPAMNRSVR